MRRNRFLVLAGMWTGCLTAVASFAATSAVLSSPAVVNFSEHGFSIQPPAGHDSAQAQQVVMMFLPATDNFAPNVNVQVQPFKGSLEEYARVSREQFKKTGLQIILEKRAAASIAFEYSGKFAQRPVRWYSRAYLSKDGIVLATATAAESQWPSVAAALRKSVDSLSLTQP